MNEIWLHLLLYDEPNWDDIYTKRTIQNSLGKTSNYKIKFDFAI